MNFNLEKNSITYKNIISIEMILFKFFCIFWKNWKFVSRLIILFLFWDYLEFCKKFNFVFKISNIIKSLLLTNDNGNIWYSILSKRFFINNFNVYCVKIFDLSYSFDVKTFFIKCSLPEYWFRKSADAMF